MSIASFGFGESLGLSASPPTAPAWGVPPTLAGNAQATLTFVAANPTDVIYARYKLKSSGAWVAESETFKRTGSGSIVVTGLTNESAYQFAGYAKFGAFTSAWLDPREAIPTAGWVVGAYAELCNAIYTAIGNSTALASKVTDGLPVAHVKLGRFLNTDLTGQDALIPYGPVHYVMPESGSWRPHSEDSSLSDLVVRVTIVEIFDQSVSDDLLTHIKYIDALRKELLTKADGTGGSASWTKGGQVRIGVEGPTVIVRDVLSTVLTVTVMVPEAA